MTLGFDRGHLSAQTEKLARDMARTQADRESAYGPTLSRFSSDRSLKVMVAHPGRLPVESTGEVATQNSDFDNIALAGYSWPSGPDIGS